MKKIILFKDAKTKADMEAAYAIYTHIDGTEYPMEEVDIVEVSDSFAICANNKCLFNTNATPWRITGLLHNNDGYCELRAVETFAEALEKAVKLKNEWDVVNIHLNTGNTDVVIITFNENGTTYQLH